MTQRHRASGEIPACVTIHTAICDCRRCSLSDWLQGYRGTLIALAVYIWIPSVCIIWQNNITTSRGCAQVCEMREVPTIIGREAKFTGEGFPLLLLDRYMLLDFLFLRITILRRCRRSRVPFRQICISTIDSTDMVLERFESYNSNRIRRRKIKKTTVEPFTCRYFLLLTYWPNQKRIESANSTILLVYYNFSLCVILFNCNVLWFRIQHLFPPKGPFLYFGGFVIFTLWFRSRIFMNNMCVCCKCLNLK